MAGEQRQHKSRRVTRIVLIVHFASILLCSISIGLSSAAAVMEGVCLHLPEPLKDACVCEAIRPRDEDEGEKSVSLVCKGLNSTRFFDFGRREQESAADINNNILGENWVKKENMMRKWVQRIELRDCSRPLANQPVTEFAFYENLRKLSIKRCGLTQESVYSYFLLSFFNQRHSSVFVFDH